jgi:chaperonin GroEL|tara:strand:- start:1816 stop:3420 length:1605 start_codon:yes stop_codon:yes gene_type:complete
MGKEVSFGTSARSKMQDGLNTLADAVKSTLGPRGRHAAIDRGFGPPLITKDGVTVARSISLDDPIMNMGAQLIKSVASATNTVAGDGTTTATVLAQSIYDEGAKMVAVGHNPVLIKRGLDIATERVVSKLKDISVTVSDSNMIKSVATISANNDSYLGGLIAEAVEAIGSDGIISVEEATGMDTSVSYTEGLKVDRGYLSSSFINNPSKLNVEYNDPFILVYDGAISASYDILPLLESISKSGSPLLIIAKDIEGEALQTMMLNQARGAISCCAIKAPGFGDIRADMLGDIAVMCGANLMGVEYGTSLRDISLSDLGRARRVVVDKNQSTIVDGAGNEDTLSERVTSIRNSLSDSSLFDWQIASLRDRLSVLSGGVAVFRVGGSTESEMKERKDRVEDSINAVKAAVEEGIVPGGGSALLHCIESLSLPDDTESLSIEESIGFDIIEKAIKSPFIQILKNSGVEHHMHMQWVIGSDNNTSGYNALDGERIDDMISAGIIDPVKVVRAALEHAVSASGTLLTTEVAIFEKREDKS